MITQEQVNSLFEYDNGVLYWKVYASSNAQGGSIAGTLYGGKYLRTRIQSKAYLNHRLIFLMHYGYLPAFVDHINGNKLDNRIENLRKANRAQNGYNSKTRSDNTSGIKGVYWDKTRNKWGVSLCVNGVNKTIGRYKDLELAELVATEARNKYHKEFARHE